MFIGKQRGELSHVSVYLFLFVCVFGGGCCLGGFSGGGGGTGVTC
mgnify:CR=1 FL=1